MRVVEKDHIAPYLESRNLLNQYRKAKLLITQGLLGSASLKKRNPKSSGIWYFRINKQYRALCVREENTLIVFDIDDHQ